MRPTQKHKPRIHSKQGFWFVSLQGSVIYVHSRLSDALASAWIVWRYQ